jgi:hypothetical protein
MTIDNLLARILFPRLEKNAILACKLNILYI